MSTRSLSLGTGIIVGLLVGALVSFLIIGGTLSLFILVFPFLFNSPLFNTPAKGDIFSYILIAIGAIGGLFSLLIIIRLFLARGQRLIEQIGESEAQKIAWRNFILSLVILLVISSGGTTIVLGKQRARKVDDQIQGSTDQLAQTRQKIQSVEIEQADTQVYQLLIKTSGADSGQYILAVNLQNFPPVSQTVTLTAGTNSVAITLDPKTLPPVSFQGNLLATITLKPATTVSTNSYLLLDSKIYSIPATITPSDQGSQLVFTGPIQLVR